VLVKKQREDRYQSLVMKDKLPPDTLAQIPYLRVLDLSQQAALQQASIRRTFAPQEIIFLEGNPSQGLWIIQSGTVKITKLSPSGMEYILHIRKEGETFNDIAALDASPYPATATALIQTTCWLIPQSTIQTILRQHPDAAIAAIHMLTARARELAQQLEALALYSVTARLARYLLKQAEESHLPEGVTRAAIASHLATTPESISRSLRSLEEAGAIRFNRHQIEITDPAMLQNLAFL
jgi:CRP-like cAMP-binding protein